MWGGLGGSLNNGRKLRSGSCPPKVVPAGNSTYIRKGLAGGDGVTSVPWAGQGGPPHWLTQS